jgi:hypothetical protein
MMQFRYSALLAFVVNLCVGASAQAQSPRFAALFADGTYVAEGRLTDWHNNDARPKLNGQELFGEANHIRFLRNSNLTLDREGEAFVEFFGGDRFPGVVTGFTTGEESFYRRELPELIATTKLDLAFPEMPRPAEFRLGAHWAKRIVWQRRFEARYSPATLYYRDGREVSFRRVRFTPRGVFLLLESGPAEVAIEEIAELHMPRRDPWEVYCEQLGALGAADARLVRLETEDGLCVTTSVARFRAHMWGDPSKLESWYRTVQPVWLREPIAVAQRRVHTLRWNAAHEVPLSAIEPAAVEQKELIGGSWPPRTNRSVRGAGLTAGGRTSAWGFGMHAACRMTFPLPAFAKSFRSWVGLDESVGRGGCAKALVYLSAGSAKPLFASEHLIGAQSRVDTQSLALELPENGRPELILAADPAHEGRPADADPFDIRDLVNWCEPTVELDREALAKEVAARAHSLVPAWDGWTVKVESDALPLADRFAQRPYDLEQKRQRFVAEVSGKNPIALSRTLRVENEHRYLMLCVEQTEVEGKPNDVIVEIDGKPYARFEVSATTWNGDSPTPRLIPIEAFRGREISVKIAQSAAGEKNRVAWRRIALIAEPITTRWTTLVPRSAKSAQGIPLSVLPDGSLLAGGKEPERDSYTIEVPTKLRGITAIRVEAMNDVSLPRGGPGRAGDGRFQLTHTKLFARPLAADPGANKALPIALAVADFHEIRCSADLTLDNRADTGWSPGEASNKPHAITYALDADPTLAEGTTFTLDLGQQFGQKQTLGRLRISATTDPLPAESEQLGRRMPLLSETPEVLAARKKVVFEDDQKFVEALTARTGKVSRETGDKFTGGASLRLSNGIAENLAIPEMNVPIRANPGAGEFRFVRFAWRKEGSTVATLQFADRGSWQANGASKLRELRYVAGKPANGGAAITVHPVLSSQWTIVTRDLFADFGEVTLTGLRLTSDEGDLLFDSLQFAQSLEDFERMPKP